MVHLLPTGLALLGTVLMALAIFAPDRAAAGGPAVSFAPPRAPAERWPAPSGLWLAPDGGGSWPPADPFAAPAMPEPGRETPEPDWETPEPDHEPDPGPRTPPPVDPAGHAPQPAAPTPARWPALVDPSAVGCDAGARLALVDALATVRAPWAAAILQRAHADDPDPEVRAALAAALRSPARAGARRT